jgi:hypothetical protein
MLVGIKYLIIGLLLVLSKPIVNDSYKTAGKKADTIHWSSGHRLTYEDFQGHLLHGLS